MNSLKLNTGQDMPILGLGTWNAPKDKVGEAVRSALEQRLRYLILTSGGRFRILGSRLFWIMLE